MKKSISDGSLYSKLKSYSQTDFVPLHMPGHKRNVSLLGDDIPYSLDITEISGFDNLHHAEGIIKQAQAKAERLYNSRHSFILVNGSTCGILAAVRTVTEYGDEIIMARNCHKSVYNACALNNLTAHYIYPPMDEKTAVSGSIYPHDIEIMLKTYPKSKAVVITSPTYEGVISNIEEICRIAHNVNVPVIVDNAHGAHQAFVDNVIGEPVACGADIVISSLHKTLPSLTQTAVAHINGDFVNAGDFSAELAVFETSSPSYVLMASADRCFDILAEHGVSLFAKYGKRLVDFDEKMKNLKNITLLCHGADCVYNHNFYGFDLGKIVICTKDCGISGVELSERLRREYHLELEMAYSFYAVAMTSICDSDENFQRLIDALSEIDEKLCRNTAQVNSFNVPTLQQSQYSPASLPKNGEILPLEQAVGKISLDHIYAYPPGIPLVVAGEIISKDIVEYIRSLEMCGVDVHTAHGDLTQIKCF